MSDYDDTWIPIEEFKWSAVTDVWEVAQAGKRRVGFAKYEISLDGHWRWFDVSTHDALDPQPTHFKPRSKPPRYVEPKVILTREGGVVRIAFAEGAARLMVTAAEYELLRKATLPPYEDLPE